MKLSAEVFDLNGKKQGILALPKEFFGQKVNKKLLTQALHIYFENRSKHVANTKTRSELRGGGAKPWRQKGTGRARAGSSRSPVWVGGAKALGPKYRNVQLTLPKKMKRLALVSSLSSKAIDNQIKIISNIEKIEPKTKILAKLLDKIDAKGSTLFIITQNNKNLKLASRNIKKTTVNSANNLNAYEIVKNHNILFSKEAINNLSMNKKNQHE
ncbi:50S ribosomal protein L4 [Candidatus Curtissbacteria bacterium RBG_13_35_7]|uniref:Large ribosomal subunit protein uL4 n=1 Tax=Candidatus Curtissbacteria bacterium RBG_13_35_7 TaxID=1797705 RepID=A0A1F5G0U6_9BACT|nr:MAG: 50S ribosomal protein L4 [Candidatus Curtissbacteria bacterium RBG_13_35_7]